MKKYLILILVLNFLLAASKPTLADLDDAFSSPRSAALGMAGAADASAEDIFRNQFGLAGLKDFGVYVSHYQLFTDTNYLNGTLYFPLGKVGVGLGYRARMITDVLLTPPDLIGADGRPDLNRLDYLNYQQGVFYLAFGYKAEKFLGLNSLDLGLAYKNYLISNSSDYVELSAQGNNVDLGLRAQFNDLYALSLIGRNVMTGSGVNGALVWQNGTVENMLQSVVLGNRFAFGEGKLLFLLDAVYTAAENYPILFSTGLESQVNDFLALRGGIRQYALLTGSTEQRIFNAVSAGLRLTPWKGIHLDYAYYPGDTLALETVHYAGLGLNISEIFKPVPKAPKPETPITESLQIIAPADHLVLDTEVLDCVLQIQGYVTLNINEQEYTLNPREKSFRTSINILPGENLIQISAGDRMLKRKVLRLRDQQELLSAGQEKDILQAVFTPEQRLGFQDKKIDLNDFAAYAVQTLNLRLPSDFAGIFNDVDILYFNGFLGKTSEGLITTPRAGYFTLGRLAEILARIDGYSDVLDAADDPQETAGEILIATGYYTAEDFTPRDTEITLSSMQSLLLRTAALNARLERELGGYPLVWLDRAQAAHGEIFLRFYSTERFANWSCSGHSATTLNEEGYYVVKIGPESMKAGTVTLNVYDKVGKHWQFTAKQVKPITEVKEVAEVKETPKVQVQTYRPATTTIRETIIVSGDAKPKILAKLSAERVKAGEILYIYAGVLAEGKTIKEVRVLHAGQKDALAVQYTGQIWRAQIKEFNPGRNYYKIVAAFTDGTMVEQTGVFWGSGSAVVQTTPAVPSASAATAVSAVKSTEQRRLNKVYYPVEITLIPAKPAAGAKVRIQAKYSAELKKVYAVIQKKNIQFQKNNNVWQGEYTLPAKSQDVFIQIYAEDTAGNLSMTEKVIRI